MIICKNFRILVKVFFSKYPFFINGEKDESQ